GDQLGPQKNVDPVHHAVKSNKHDQRLACIAHEQRNDSDADDSQLMPTIDRTVSKKRKSNPAGQ
ncbi:MAG: hypothetical protein JJE12_13810, partial [Anaerolineales bacterium]|nr:hypothetical protein [Anaerolineales bacterium]